MAQCGFCFRNKTPLQPPIPGISVVVCKACLYQIDRVLGFLQYHGAKTIVESGAPTFYTPPNPPKAKRKARKDSVDDKPPTG